MPNFKRKVKPSEDGKSKYGLSLDANLGISEKVLITLLMLFFSFGSGTVYGHGKAIESFSQFDSGCLDTKNNKENS